jgi:hypothetical protein
MSKMKNFNTEAKKILIEYSCKSPKGRDYNLEVFEKKTNYGNIKITLDHDKSPVYTVYMRFEQESFNKIEFEKMFGFEGFNTWSYKWNLHTFTPAEALQVLENRLDALTYPIS